MADTLKPGKKIFGRFKIDATVDALCSFNFQTGYRVRTLQKSLRELDKWLIL